MNLAAMHSGFRVWPLFVSVLALSAVAASWLSVIYGLRIKELQYRLRTNTDRQQAVRTMSLVSRLDLLLKKSVKAGEKAAYSREGKLMQALRHTLMLSEIPNLAFAERIGLGSIEFFNLLAGSPGLKYELESPTYVAMETAFFSEMRRNYHEAIDIYSSLLQNPQSLSSDWRAYIRLHRGFCLALSQERTAARIDFADVIANHRGEYEATAVALLKRIDEVENSLSNVDRMELSTTKGTAYYQLTAYEKAIQTFNRLDKTNHSPSTLYYLGRSHEETGNESAAAGYYRRIIAKFRNSDWATKANRRLYAMGAFYDAGDGYRNESKSNAQNKIVDDAAMLQDVRSFEKVAEYASRFAISPATSVPAAGGLPIQNSGLSREHTVSTVAVPADRKRITHKAPTAKNETWAALDRARTWEQKEALSRKEKAEYLRRQRFLARFALADGNYFAGVIITETPQTVLLFTVIGKVSIDKAQIVAREKITQ